MQKKKSVVKQTYIFVEVYIHAPSYSPVTSSLIQSFLKKLGPSRRATFRSLMRRLHFFAASSASANNREATAERDATAFDDFYKVT